MSVVREYSFVMNGMPITFSLPCPYHNPDGKVIGEVIDYYFKNNEFMVTIKYHSGLTNTIKLMDLRI